jgi:hypothetical protein
MFDSEVHTDVMNGRVSIDRSLLAWADHRDLWQGVLNECFLPERVVEQAWRGSDTVIAQVEWEHDGLEEIETVVLAKAGDLRQIQLVDDRRFIKALWLHRDHVREVSRLSCSRWCPGATRSSGAVPAPAQLTGGGAGAGEVAGGGGPGV